jgi:hypothetical protein
VRYSFEIHSSAHNAPPVCQAGNEAFGFFVVCAVNRQPEADPTYVSRERVGALVKEPELSRLAARLVNSGLWTPEGNGWRMIPKPQGRYHLKAPIWRMRPILRREPIADSVRRAVFERDGSACLECGTTDDLTLDHIHPWSKGGPDTFENLRVLCRSCNSSKGARV